MKKCFTYLISLTALLFISDRVLYYILDSVIDKSNSRHVNMFHENPDIYAVGNSRGVFSIWETEFDKTYDLDMLNISFTRLNSESIAHLTKAINKEKIILIEISAFLSPDPKEMGDISPIFGSTKGLRQEKTLASEGLSSFFKSYNFNNRSTLRLLYHLFKTDKNWTQKRTINTSIITKLKQSDGHKLYVKDQFFTYLEYLKKENYNFVFYHAPYHPQHCEKILNINEVNQKLNTLLGDHFLDLTKLLKEDKYFADGIHSNYHATKFIHQEIVNHIKKLPPN